jgi:hypothetical protein
VTPSEATSFAFNIKGRIADIDGTGGSEPIHPAKIFLIEWGDYVRRVLVPLHIFEPYRDALHVGTVISINGNVHEMPGRTWYIGTSMRTAGQKR